MSDVVIHLPVERNEEDRLLGYIKRFFHGLSAEIERWTVDADAPFMMMSSDPALGDGVRVLVFQEADAAHAFRTGWAAERRRPD
jgi:hypothetical protein